jgi:hypothetical protein
VPVLCEGASRMIRQRGITQVSLREHYFKNVCITIVFPTRLNPTPGAVAAIQSCAVKMARSIYHETSGRPPPGQPRTAPSMAATSIFFIGIIASKARLATSPPTVRASVKTRGVICHEMPHLSLHQPH